MKNKIKAVVKFFTDVFLMYCVLVLIMLSVEIALEIPLVGIPLLSIALVINGIEKLKERDTK